MHTQQGFLLVFGMVNFPWSTVGECLGILLLGAAALVGFLCLSIRIFSWLKDKTDRELKDELRNALEVTAFLTPGKWHSMRVVVYGKARLFRVYVPENVEWETADVWLAADGVTFLRREGNMAEVNGCREAADRNNAILVVLYPEKTRNLGLLSGWNHPGGFLEFDKNATDDVDYVLVVLSKIHQNWPIHGHVVLIGFSAGATLMHRVAAIANPGSVALVVSVCGSVLDNVKPKPKIGLIAIHGESDPRLPFKGGAGPGITSRLLIALGHKGILNSRPAAQAPLYCEANELDHAFPPQDHRDDYNLTVTGWLSAEQVPIIQILVKNEYGGHSFPGRAVGGSNESVVSKGHGTPAPRTILDPFQWIDEVLHERNQDYC